MADALKRIQMSNNKAFQKRCMFFMYEQADIVFNQDPPDPDDLSLAKAIWAGQVRPNDMARIVITNATVGGKVDTDQNIPDSDIEFVIKSDGKFNDLASAYKAAGLIS